MTPRRHPPRGIPAPAGRGTVRAPPRSVNVIDTALNPYIRIYYLLYNEFAVAFPNRVRIHDRSEVEGVRAVKSTTPVCDEQEATPPATPRAGRRLAILAIALVGLILLSFPLGTYGVDVGTVVHILFSQLTGTPTSATDTEITVVTQIRLPRILGAVLVGAALAAAGAGYQSMFRNPLVSPDILGVSAGAGFGAATGILLEWPWPLVQASAFVCGIAATIAAVTISRLFGRGSAVVLVLAGIVVSTLFNAFISITQYLANPDDTLPTITFWLMGGLGRIRTTDLWIAAAVIAVCLLALYVVRWPVSVMAAGDEEAGTLGVDRRRVWIVVVTASTLMTATAVGLAGIVGWVGLVVPHLARFLVGPSFGRQLPAAVLIGGGFLLLVDDVARSATSAELPLGILTAIIGAPFFVLLLARARRQWL